MRLSAMRGDAGYRSYRRLPRGVISHVFIEGVYVTDCVTADTRRGFVLVAVRDGQGRMVINARHSAVVLQCIYGRVAIELRRVDRRTDGAVLPRRPSPTCGLGKADQATQNSPKK